MSEMMLWHVVVGSFVLPYLIGIVAIINVVDDAVVVVVVVVVVLHCSNGGGLAVQWLALHSSSALLRVVDDGIIATANTVIVVLVLLPLVENQWIGVVIINVEGGVNSDTNESVHNEDAEDHTDDYKVVFRQELGNHVKERHDAIVVVYVVDDDHHVVHDCHAIVVDDILFDNDVELDYCFAIAFTDVVFFSFSVHSLKREREREQASRQVAGRLVLLWDLLVIVV